MSKIKPERGKKLTLEGKLDGSDVKGEAGFSLVWKEDLSSKLSAADQVEALDDRNQTIKLCSKWCDLKTTIKGNKATVELDSTVPHDAWGGNTNAKEIYACIRAEYKFIDKDGYKKVSSRTNGSQGIDHIFMKGKDTVIVESKTIADLSKIKKVSTIKDPDTIISVLGKGRQVGSTKNGGVIYATQMSLKWLRSCLKDLESKEKATVKKIRSEWRKGNPPKRVLNIYGGIDWNADKAYDELVEEAKKQYNEAKSAYDEVNAELAEAIGDAQRIATAERRKVQVKQRYGNLPEITKKSINGNAYQASKVEETGKKQLLYIYRDWKTVDPEKGLFYLLPGKYEQTRARLGSYNKPESVDGEHEVDFADEKFRDNEFFDLGRLKKSTLAKLDKLKKEDAKKKDSLAGDSGDI